MNIILKLVVHFTNTENDVKLKMRKNYLWQICSDRSLNWKIEGINLIFSNNSTLAMKRDHHSKVSELVDKIKIFYVPNNYVKQLIATETYKWWKWSYAL